MKDSSRSNSGSPNGDRSERSNCGITLQQYADAKGFPLPFLKGLGLADCKNKGQARVRIPYMDSHGHESSIRYRLSLEGKDRFRWKKGSKALLYGLWRRDYAKTEEYITLVEGESDSQTLWLHGESALGLPGAGTWNEDWAEHLEGVPTIYVVIEPDQGGEATLKWIAKSQIRDRVKIISDLKGYKDISELHLRDQDNFKTQWEAILQKAKSWHEVERERSLKIAEESFQEAKSLLQDPDILGRIGDVISEKGYAGNLNPPLLSYIGITSRLLDSPLNMAFVAPSGAGKNRAVDAAVELFPLEAVYTVQAASSRALIYSEESYQHRIIIFAEADSIPDDGSAASAIRSLVTDNCMTYGVVEEGSDGKHKTRRIEKQGPTGLITTSTRSLSKQMNTRILEIPISDSPDQTKAIMKAQAQAVMGGGRSEINLRPYIAVQQYLEHSKVQQVNIPYAAALAELIPSGEVRMRRDFNQLLIFIQAVTLLHQCQRELEEGAVLATLDDYELARNLLSDVFDSIISQGVTPAIRKTVEAVKSGEEISNTDLAKRLGLKKSTVSERVKRCLQGGWLVNEETVKGKPYRLKRGEPLPDENSALPTREKVELVWERDAIRSTPDQPELSPNGSTGKSQEVFGCSGVFPVEAPLLPCCVCGEENWWKGPAGMKMCGTCHPPAEPELARQWIGQDIQQVT